MRSTSSDNTNRPGPKEIDESPASVAGVARFLQRKRGLRPLPKPQRTLSATTCNGGGYGAVQAQNANARSRADGLAPLDIGMNLDVEEAGTLLRPTPEYMPEPRAYAHASGGGLETDSLLPRHGKDAAALSPPRAKLANLWAPVSLGLPAAYFFIGIATSFITTPLQVYMVQDLDAEPAAQNTLNVLTTLPWSFKLLFGFLSDVQPVFGARRKPYMIIGSLMHAVSFLMLAALGEPSMQSLSTLMWVATMGEIMVDVMADTLAVERSRYEPSEGRGQMQATCYALRFFGSVLGAGTGTLVYNKDAWGWGLSFAQVCFVLGVFPLLFVVPFAYMVWEKPLSEAGAKSVPEQCRDIWNTVTLDAVWMPMTFVYIYNVMQIPNVAWSSFLQLDLGFPPWALGIMTTTGAIMTFLGIVAFKKFFFKTSWRYIYISSTLLCTTFSLLQLVLIFHLNRGLGISDYFFALGDDVMSAYINGIQFLPVCIMYMKLCPGGSEGATYAMLTTLGNIALCVASSLGNVFTYIPGWDVSNAAIERGDMYGMWHITICTSVLSTLPLMLLFLLPHGHEAQLELQANKHRTTLGGIAFLVALIGSLTWTSSEAVITVLGE
uniref:Major facilitator superfamily (MFS) profile domain-containing protein n=1 Tax=Phaeomonas parva TaxID=124430 RepID=A0A7S1TWA3_9STRA|mmetsp:Transcript_20792/g.63257  ORF Transcript_20792/g.63257 Transcript_20792/m.63257 type:complete len:606 (+) Transcript_20792:318-2135(+)